MTSLPQVDVAVPLGPVGTAAPLARASGESATPVAGFPGLLSLLMSGAEPVPARPPAPGQVYVATPSTEATDRPHETERSEGAWLAATLAAASAIPAVPAPEPGKTQPSASEAPKPLPAPALLEALVVPRAAQGPAAAAALRTSAALAQVYVATPSTEATDRPHETEGSGGAWLAATLAAASAIQAVPAPAPGEASPVETDPTVALSTEPAESQPFDAVAAGEALLASPAAGHWRGSPERPTRPASAQLSNAPALAEAPALAVPAAPSAAAELPPAPPVGPHMAVPAPDGQSQTSPRPELPLQIESTGAGRDLSREPAVALPHLASGPRQPDSLARGLDDGGDSLTKPPEVAEPPARGPRGGRRLPTTWTEPGASEGQREAPAKPGNDEASHGDAAAFRTDLSPGTERAGNAAASRGGEASRTQAAPVETPVAEQVVERLGVITRDGRHQISLRLDPPELGAVRIDAVLHNRELTLHIRAELAPAREALEQALPWLRESLAAQGLVAAHVTVDLGLDSAPRGFSREGSAAFEGALSSEPNERPRESQGAPPGGEAARPALVDLWV
jgi:flagellar hook-length control protein FliK